MKCWKCGQEETSGHFGGRGCSPVVWNGIVVKPPELKPIEKIDAAGDCLCKSCITIKINGLIERVNLLSEGKK